MARTSEGVARGLRRVPAYAPPTGEQPAPPTGRAERKRPENGRRKKIKYSLFALGSGLDLPLFVFLIVLLAIGLVMLFSASYAYCYYYYGNSYFFIARQAGFAAVGVVLMLLVSTFDYHQFHKFAHLVFGIAVLLLLIVLVLGKLMGGVTPLVRPKNDVYRWINLGVEFQPTEIAKFAVVLLFAHMISQRADQMKTFRYGFLPFMGVLALLVVLIMPEPHVSATIIVCLIGIIMMFIGGSSTKWFIIFGGIAVVGVAAVVMFSGKFDYAMDRIYGWLDPFHPPEGVDTWQTTQSLYAIGSGGLLGVGLGQSRQKYLYLPEPQNDFIFAIICEELGMVGALVIIILFGLLIWRGVYVSVHAKDKFGMMLGLGITFQVGIQAVLNICVVTNTIPNTGISLPFFSYGGTALMMLLMEMGVLLNISRSSNVEKT